MLSLKKKKISKKLLVTKMINEQQQNVGDPIIKRGRVGFSLTYLTLPHFWACVHTENVHVIILKQLWVHMYIWNNMYMYVIILKQLWVDMYILKMYIKVNTCCNPQTAVSVHVHTENVHQG